MLVDEDPPLIGKVGVDDAKRQIIRVVWKGGKRARTRDDTDFVDLSPAIESGNRYRLLRLRPALFDDIEVVDGGRAIAWFNASITMSAEVIESLAPKRRVTDLALLWDDPRDGGNPVIISADPSSAGPGSLITITGNNFINVTQVLFDIGGVDTPAVFTIVSDNTITATVP